MKLSVRQFIWFICALTTSLEVSASLNIQNTPPASGADYTFTETPATDLFLGDQRPVGSFFFNSIYNYTTSPLVGMRNGEKIVLMESLRTLDLRAGYLVKPDVLVSLHTTLNAVEMSNQQKFKVGDLSLRLKYRLNENTAPVRFSLVPEIFFPTGSDESYLSNGKLSGSFKLVSETTFKWMKVAANVGYRHSPDDMSAGLDYRNLLMLAIGSMIPVTEKFALNLEVAGYPSVPYHDESSPGDFYAGGLWAHSKSLVFMGGVSSSGFAHHSDVNNSYRFIAGLKYQSGF